MTSITIHTSIHAAVETCFDLARDAGVHLRSTHHTGERVVSGRHSGLFELNDEVTWEAIHLGIKQQLSTRITKLEQPLFFEATMLRGAFKSMRHEHHFKRDGDGCVMTDVFEYEVPLGWLGKLFDYLYLKQYMTRLLTIRNTCIRDMAEEKDHGGTV